MGQVVAICLSEARGTPKQCLNEALLIGGLGLKGDAHAGDWHRQVSVLPEERILAFRESGAEVGFGDFGENLVIRGVDWRTLAVGDSFRVGGAVLELTQFGKECTSRCRIYDAMGDCIMPRHGMFARVVEGGTVRVGDAVAVCGGEGT